MVYFNGLSLHFVQPWSFAIKRILNKPYENEVTLILQGPPNDLDGSGKVQGVI